VVGQANTGEDTKQQVGRSMVDAWVGLATVRLRWMCQTRWHGSMGAFLFIYYLTLPSPAYACNLHHPLDIIRNAASGR
jgi:hypothetical protein